MAWLPSTRPIGRTCNASRRHRNPLPIGFIAALVALSLVLSGCASTRDPTMARIFEAPNVIHVCVRPPNVPKDKRMWALDADGSPVFEAREVDLARRAGLGVYIWDEVAPRESARLLPIPYHRLECPAPPRPRVAAAKVDAKEKVETEEAERPKPLQQPIPRETSAVERRVEAHRCTAYAEPGQTRRRSGSGARTCTRVLVHRGPTEPVAAESPRVVEPPEPARLSEEAAREYEDWGLTPADVSALAQDRARECLQGLCHARHPNFVPKSKKKPAETHNGQSLSTGSGSGGGASAPQPAPKTTVKTRTKPVPAKSNGVKPNGAAAGQAGSGSAVDPPPQAKPKRGGENPAAARGREVHEEFKKKVQEKGWTPEPHIKVQGGTYVKPDAVTPKGHPIELKPNTPTGREAGKRQMQKYEEILKKKGRVIYYDP
ncbi:hypothetical protein [Polyangium sp. 15x6]|uniref:hypothetical protein n=1 Tax=Polyangium sp. 15x6 TaxID=3042687 RepID=UPI00249A9F9C|nr:hypothetical protein [Polyangium sp. 15x6]MDI3286811.1 hypothetical protein [Polyangium sp. 15x6]